VNDRETHRDFRGSALLCRSENGDRLVINLRGFYFDFETEAPGPLLSTSAEVVEGIASLDAVSARYADA
jgi:CDP-glycerol glycerophosphotransferase (TagB/SpsB family)